MLKAIVIILAALAVIAVFLPARMSVSREAIVSASPDVLVPLLADYRARNRWIPWTESDPGARYEFAGEGGHIGSTMQWDGDEVGRATLTLERADSEAVISRMQYDAPLPMVTRDRFELEALEDGRTRVRWSNEGELPFGPARIFALFADRIIGPDYERGLDRLGELVRRGV
ncbi:MAG: SRPBCC family protein [Myxococcota bacterium]